jgi:hypothetical protein
MSDNQAVYDPVNYDPTKDPSAMAQNSAQVEHILTTITNKNDQIDAICEARGWKHVNTELRDVLDSYLDGTLSADETLDLLATPIEACTRPLTKATSSGRLKTQRAACVRSSRLRRI